MLHIGIAMKKINIRTGRVESFAGEISATSLKDGKRPGSVRAAVLSIILLSQASLALPRTAAAADADAPSADGDAPIDVVVTASRSAEKITDVPASVSVISAATIQDTPSLTLDDVLRDVPGINLPFASSADIHPTSSNTSMRGLSGNRALVLLDGIPINDAFFGYVQWNRISMENVDRVEVVRGGDSTLWGDHAMGGVINVITRAPTQDEFAVDVSGGTFNTYLADLYGAYVLSDAASFSLDSNYTRSEGFQQYPPGVKLEVSRPTQPSAYNLNLDGDFKPWSGLTAGVKVGFNDFDQSPLNEIISENHQQIWSFSGNATQALDYGMSVALLGFYNNSHFWTANAGTPTGAITGDVEYIQNQHTTPVHDEGGSLVFSQTVSDWFKSYSVGVDLHKISGQDAAANYEDTLGLPPEYLRTDVGRGTQTFLGAFVRAGLEPIEHLNIDLAGRYQDFKNSDAYDGTPGGLGVIPDRSEGTFDPRAAAKYAFTPDFALRAAVYKAFNAPTLDELYRTYSTLTGTFRSSALLTPETLKGGEVGFDAGSGPVTVQVTTFYDRIDNLITSRSLTDAELPAGFEFGSVNINAGSARSEGAEGAVVWKMASGLAATISYTYADSVITASPYDPISVGKQLANVPRSMAAAQLSYTGFHDWRFSVDGRYVTETFGDNDHTLIYPAHFVMDASTSYPVYKKVEAYLDIQNLLARRYIGLNDGGSPEQWGTPFTVMVGVRAKFN
jgi:outer membrane receptor protein involved in Fe transport